MNDLQPKIITFDQYEYYKKLSRFKCPAYKNPLYCPHDCVTRPKPCEECPHMNHWNTVFEGDRPQWLKEHEFEVLRKNCDACEAIKQWMKEDTYYEECIQHRKAVWALIEVSKGNLEIMGNGLW